MTELFRLFLAFAKIGGFTFGGGLAMLPMMQREIVEHHGWATENELIDYYAIGQCTPGIIAVNVATFIGCKRKGLFGGIFATLGVVFPSVVIITLIAACIRNFQDVPAVQWAFSGIRPAVAALVLDAVLKVGKKSLVDAATVLIFLAVIALSFLTSVSPAVFVLCAGLMGILLKGGTRNAVAA